MTHQSSALQHASEQTQAHDYRITIISQRVSHSTQGSKHSHRFKKTKQHGVNSQALQQAIEESQALEATEQTATGL